MSEPQNEEQGPPKRRRVSGPSLIVPFSTGDIVSNVLPEEVSRRTVGVRYLCNNTVRIWNGRVLLCEHAKEVRYCRECKVPIKPRETADKVSPHLLDEWSDENEHPMSFYSGYSNRKVKWICRDDASHKWDAKLNNRARGTGCPHCASHKPVHDPVIRREVLARERVRTKPSGEEAETWFVDLFRSLPGVENVEHTGFKFDKTDIVVTFNGQKKSVQVKGMSQKVSTNPNMFNFQCMNSYVPDMLVVSVDLSRTRFAALFYHQFNAATSLCFTFGNPRCKLRDSIFTDPVAFQSKLLELLPQAANHIDTVSESNQKEFAMWNRLVERCAVENIPLIRNVDATSTIDAWVGGRGCQLKYLSLPAKGSRTYQAKLQKYGGMIGGKEIRAAYSIDDPIDFFIVEVGGTETDPERYHGQFCVISRATAIERGMFSTAENEGKSSVCICPPDYPRSHWALQAWSLFSSTFGVQ